MGKRKSKKLIGLVLMMFMLSILAGCGGANTAKDTIPVGINCELSGGVASYGSNAKDGAILAIEEINAKGGVLGKQLKEVIKDNKSLADEAMSASAALVGQKIVAQIGPLTSGNVQGSTPVLMDNKIPLIAPAATASNVTVDEKTGNTLDYIFRVCFIDPFQGTLMAQFATDMGAKNVAIYKDASSDYGKGLAEYFKKTFEANGGKIIAEEGFVKGDREFRATLTKIRALKPDFIYIPGYYEEVAPLIKQAREAGINVAIGGCDGWDSPDMISVAGAEALNNTFFTNHYSSQDDDPKVVAFVQAFKKKFNNKEPDSFSALGYDAVQILAQAIKDAGEANPQKIRDALAKIKNFEGVTGKMTIDEQHNPVKAGVIIEYKDGLQVMKTRIQP